MTIRHLYPAVEPSLNLDFANSKKLDPRITFTRASTGTYVGADGLIKTAAANEARFDHDGDGNSLGLLIEEARTNYIPNSVDLTAWSQVSGAVLSVSSSVTAPDGATTSSLLTLDSTSSYVQTAYTIPAATTACLTLFVKKASLNVFQLSSSRSSSMRGKFDLTTGQWSETVGNIDDYSAVEFPNGWWRLTIKGYDTGTLITYLLAGDAIISPSTPAYYVWGVQIEHGTFPTSYIPTSGSTVTRSADVASMTGTNFSSWYNQSEGTVLIELPKNLSSVENNDVMFSFHNGSTNRVLAQWVTYSWFWKAAGTQVAINPYVSYASTAGTYAFSFDSNNISATYNGQAVNTATSSSLSQDATSLRLFAEWDGGRQVHGIISRLTYYPVRLPDATLQALTL